MSRQLCGTAIFLTNLVITKHSECSQTSCPEAGSPHSPCQMRLALQASGNERMISSLVMNQRGRLHMNHSALHGDFVLTFISPRGSGGVDAQELAGWRMQGGLYLWWEGLLAFLISCDNSEIPYFIKPKRDMVTHLDLVK